jgi:hypothetical protein
MRKNIKWRRRVSLHETWKKPNQTHLMKFWTQLSYSDGSQHTSHAILCPYLTLPFTGGWNNIIKMNDNERLTPKHGIPAVHHSYPKSLQYITVTPNTPKCINLADQYNKQEYKHLLWIGFMSSLQFLLFLDIGLIVLQYSTFRHPFIPAASHMQCWKTYSIILWQGCKQS